MSLISLAQYGKENKVVVQTKRDLFTTITELALSFTHGEIITIGGRPSTGKSEILLKVLETRNIHRKEKSLFINFNKSPLFQFSTIEFQLKGGGEDQNVLMSDVTISKYHEAIELIESAISEHQIETIYLDDIYCFETFIDGDKIEFIDEHFCYSHNMIMNSANFYSKLVEIVNIQNVNIILTAPLLRSVEERGGDKKPLIVDLYTHDLELVSSKILLVYKPENYGFEEDENGNSVINKTTVLVKRNKQQASNYAIDYWME